MSEMSTAQHGRCAAQIMHFRVALQGRFRKNKEAKQRRQEFTADRKASSCPTSPILSSSSSRAILLRDDFHLGSGSCPASPQIRSSPRVLQPLPLAFTVGPTELRSAIRSSSPLSTRSTRRAKSSNTESGARKDCDAEGSPLAVEVTWLPKGSSYQLDYDMDDLAKPSPPIETAATLPYISYDSAPALRLGPQATAVPRSGSPSPRRLSSSDRIADFSPSSEKSVGHHSHTVPPYRGRQAMIPVESIRGPFTPPRAPAPVQSAAPDPAWQSGLYAITMAYLSGAVDSSYRPPWTDVPLTPEDSEQHQQQYPRLGSITEEEWDLESLDGRQSGFAYGDEGWDTATAIVQKPAASRKTVRFIL